MGCFLTWRLDWEEYTSELIPILSRIDFFGVAGLRVLDFC